MNGVSRESYQEMRPNDKLNVLFDMTQEIYDVSCSEDDKLDVRVTKLEKRKWWNTAASGGGGIIGGVLAYFGVHIGG